MTLTDRILSLGQLTLQDPRQAARALLGEDIPVPARTAGLLLVAVLSAFMISLQAGLQPQPVDPITAFMTTSPIRTAVVQWFALALTVVLIHNVGRAFGGQGSFADALLIVVWLQLIMLALQALQLLAFLLAPTLGGIIGLASLFLFFWLMTNFVAELHGFASLGLVFLGMIIVTIVTALILGVAAVMIVGPEALQPNV
jgi:hypothetical protein